VEIEAVADVRTKPPADPYVINRRGTGYEITFGGETFTVKADIAIAYIVTFFRHTNEAKDPLAIYMEAWGTVAEVKDSETETGEDGGEDSQSGGCWSGDREQAKRNWLDGLRRWKRLQHLEERGEERDGSDLDDDELAEFVSLRRDITDPATFLKYLVKQKAIADGRKLADGDDRVVKREAMSKAINRKLAAIIKHCPIPVSPSAQQAGSHFCEHVRRYLLAGNLKCYDPPPGVSWILPG
jgi:hypothetical protein